MSPPFLVEVHARQVGFSDVAVTNTINIPGVRESFWKPLHKEKNPLVTCILFQFGF